LNAIPVHPSRDWGFIALLPVAVLADSLKIGFDYHRVYERVKISDLIAVSTTSTKPVIRLQYLYFGESKFFTDTMQISVIEAHLRLVGGIKSI